jgi:hypothetical protein
MTMRTTLAWIAMLTGMLAPLCRGQGTPDQGISGGGMPGQAPETTAPVTLRSGFNFNGVSLFSGFTNSSSSLSDALGPNSGLVGSGTRITYGVTTGLTWLRNRPKTNITLRYSASYTGIGQYSRFDALNGTILVGVNHDWGKWTGSLTGSFADMTAAEYPFQNSSLGGISQTPANFNDLAASQSVGPFTSSQTAAAFATTPDLNPNGYLYGGRVLTYALTPSLTYARSSRWRFHFASGSAFGQTRSNGQNITMPRGANINAGVETSYLLSPRTQLGFGVEEQSVFNNYQKIYGTVATVSLGRKMGQHWLLRGHGGTVFGTFSNQSYGLSSRPPVIGGGSVAFQLQNQTFLGTYNRSAFDSYGYGAGTSTNMSAAWSWHRPRAWWRMTAQAGQHQIRNTGFASLSGWQASAGLSGRLKEHISLSANYVYFSSTGTYAGIFNSFSFSGLRVSLGWAPQALQPSRP